MPLTALQKLQKKCKAAGLSAKGNTVDLTNRLQEMEMSRQESLEESEDGSMCDAVLLTQVKIGSEEDIKMDAKAAFERVLDDLEVEEVRGAIYVGNRRGLNLADLKERVNIIEEHSRKLEQRDLQKDADIASLQCRLDQTEDRLSVLTLALEEYKEV